VPELVKFGGDGDLSDVRPDRLSRIDGAVQTLAKYRERMLLLIVL
jgi:hypothetical protein